jgi:hypothetical protein
MEFSAFCTLPAVCYGSSRRQLPHTIPTKLASGSRRVLSTFVHARSWIIAITPNFSSRLIQRFLLLPSPNQTDCPPQSFCRQRAFPSNFAVCYQQSLALNLTEIRDSSCSGHVVDFPISQAARTTGSTIDRSWSPFIQTARLESNMRPSFSASLKCSLQVSKRQKW